MKKSRNTLGQIDRLLGAVVKNLRRMATEQQRLLVRLHRAQALVSELRQQAKSADSWSMQDDRLLDQYELFVLDVETYLDHYQFEIKKVERGLKQASALENKPAQLAFLQYIAEDSSRTVVSLKIANHEYHEILITLPVEGYDS